LQLRRKMMRSMCWHVLQAMERKLACARCVIWTLWP
jgi:hypothetical protein